jgi:hypothetical protein
MSQKCLKNGCDRDAEPGSNYCHIHALKGEGQYTYKYPPEKPEPSS